MALITPKIGTFEFLNMTDWIDYAGLKFVDITRPGHPGRAFQVSNILAEPTPVRTITSLSSLANADFAMKHLYKAALGQVAVVTDQFGNTRNYIWLSDVRQIDAWATGGHGTDSSILALMECVWTLVDVSIAY